MSKSTATYCNVLMPKLVNTPINAFLPRADTAAIGPKSQRTTRAIQHRSGLPFAGGVFFLIALSLIRNLCLSAGAALRVESAVPFTVIMPANCMVLATGRDPTSAETHALLIQWGKLHAVRTLCSLISAVLCLWFLGRH